MQASDSSIDNPKSGAETAPLYGNKEYWEERYARPHVKGDDPTQFHAWYYTYKDLRPILLPLLLGTESADKALAADCPGKCFDDNESEPIDANNVGGKVAVVAEIDKASPRSAEEESVFDNEEVQEVDDVRGDSSDSGGEFVEVEEVDGEADEDEDVVREPLNTPGGPLHILEVGCGNVPLGKDLVDELKGSSPIPSHPLALIQVVCIDYSPSVIDQMKKLYLDQPLESAPKRLKTSSSTEEYARHGPQIGLEFHTEDARKLSYASGSFHMVLDKGTLDAMLSDKYSGISNCQQIVRECGRVLKIPGVLVIVSHLNAMTPAGIEWLEGVVFEGLKTTKAAWCIEAHSSGGKEEEELGPAVYVIHKKPATTEADGKIPVRVMTY